MMKTEVVDPTAIEIPHRLRALDPANVKQLAESMDAIGLQQPVTVWSPVDGECILVAGAHRVKAACDLGWDWIDCIFADGMTDIDRQPFLAQRRSSLLRRLSSAIATFAPDIGHGLSAHSTEAGCSDTDSAYSDPRVRSQAFRQSGTPERRRASVGLTGALCIGTQRTLRLATGVADTAA